MKTFDFKMAERDLLTALERSAHDRLLLRDFLVDLLSPQEYGALLQRWQVVRKLHSGIPHQQIAAELGVGVATVTRGSRELRDQRGGFARLLKIISKP